jgi:hypothetical protein
MQRLCRQAGRARRRGQLPTKQANNSADRAYGKRREGLQIKLSVDLCPKPSFESYKSLENYAAGVQEKLTSP